MTVFDILTLGGGILLIVAPSWTYNAFRKEKLEVPKNWVRTSRIVGVVFVLIGLFFLYQSLSR